MKRDTEEAKRLLKELRQNIAKRHSPFAGMSEEEVINRLRKTREKLWEEKLAVCSGRQ